MAFPASPHSNSTEKAQELPGDPAKTVGCLSTAVLTARSDLQKTPVTSAGFYPSSIAIDLIAGFVYFCGLGFLPLYGHARVATPRFIPARAENTRRARRFQQA